MYACLCWVGGRCQLEGNFDRIRQVPTWVEYGQSTWYSNWSCCRFSLSPRSPQFDIKSYGILPQPWQWNNLMWTASNSNICFDYCLCNFQRAASISPIRELDTTPAPVTWGTVLSKSFKFVAFGGQSPFVSGQYSAMGNIFWPHLTFQDA